LFVVLGHPVGLIDMEYALVTHQTIGHMCQGLCVLGTMILQVEETGLNSPSDFRGKQNLLELEGEVLLSIHSWIAPLSQSPGTC